MATPVEQPRWDEVPDIFPDEVWISERQGISAARKAAEQESSEEDSTLPRLLRRILRPGRSRRHSRI